MLTRLWALIFIFATFLPAHVQNVRAYTDFIVAARARVIVAIFAAMKDLVLDKLLLRSYKLIGK